MARGTGETHTAPFWSPSDDMHCVSARAATITQTILTLLEVPALASGSYDDSDFNSDESLEDANMAHLSTVFLIASEHPAGQGDASTQVAPTGRRAISSPLTIHLAWHRIALCPLGRLK